MIVSSSERSQPAAMFLGESVAVVLPLTKTVTVSAISYITDLFRVTKHTLYGGAQTTAEQQFLDIRALEGQQGGLEGGETFSLHSNL